MEKKEYEMHIEKIKKELGDRMMKRLIAYRKSLGLTQQNIADRTGIQRPNIARVESGRLAPSLETLIKIAESMDLEVKIDFMEKKKAI